MAMAMMNPVPTEEMELVTANKILINLAVLIRNINEMLLSKKLTQELKEELEQKRDVCVKEHRNLQIIVRKQLRPMGFCKKGLRLVAVRTLQKAANEDIFAT